MHALCTMYVYLLYMNTRPPRSCDDGQIQCAQKCICFGKILGIIVDCSCMMALHCLSLPNRKCVYVYVCVCVRILVLFFRGSLTVNWTAEAIVHGHRRPNKRAFNRYMTYAESIDFMAFGGGITFVIHRTMLPNGQHIWAKYVHSSHTSCTQYTLTYIICV